MKIRRLGTPRRQPDPKTNESLVRQGRMCPYCGSGTRVIDSALVYGGQSYGWMVACARWPQCDSYVGCHPRAQRPLGRLANKELRAAKSRAHEFLDRLWKPKTRRPIEWVRERRRQAYAWLAQAMGIKEARCHIGMFDVGDCSRVVELCREKLQEMKTRATGTGPMEGANV